MKKFYRFSMYSLIISISLSVAVCVLPEQPEYVSVEKKDFISWVDFNVTYEALSDCLEYDVATYGTKEHTSWIKLLAYLASSGSGKFDTYKKSTLNKVTAEIKAGKTIEELSNKLTYYPYYLEAYEAVLGGFVGEYEIEKEDGTFEKKYGLKAFSPIAKGYSYSHFDDFGASRSYGFKRKHLGHDMMGSVGTPIIAIESGYVECVGWNQYGGWRIGIRSFDKKRYYYYAHLRKDHPYNDMYEGKIITAGDVIGYLGMTGYSTKENVNNINTPHLHWGMQLIFDESQKEANSEIWIDIYAITKLLERNRSAVVRNDEEKEYERIYEMFEKGMEK